MEPIAKVVYPTPPPTTNNLTTKQRSLLLRKAKKIEQILGYPPHLIDTLYNTDGTPASPPSISPPDGRSSVESSSSTLVCLNSLEHKENVSWFCYPHGSRNATSTKGMNQIPLHAASKSMRVELMAVTNWPVKPSVTIASPESCAPPPPDSDLPLRSSLTDPVIAVPTFNIPTSHTHRKAKMDRIRRRLGSEVPCEVVFPEDAVNCKWSNSEKLTPRRKDGAVKPLPSVPSNPSQRHLVVNAKKERLSFIRECSDESIGGCQELTVDLSRMEDGTPRRRDTAYSTYSGCSDRDGQGVMTSRRHPPSYRKPPPPMLDDSVCSF